jgi:hypothetical protein
LAAACSSARRSSGRPGGGAYGDDGGALEERARDVFFHFETHEPDEVRVDEIGLGEGDDALSDAEEAADIEMLARLGLDGFIGRHDEQDEIYSGDAGEHVLDEALMAGNIDEAEPQRGRELQVGEADIDGDAAALLLFEAVGVDAGERFD